MPSFAALIVTVASKQDKSLSRILIVGSFDPVAARVNGDRAAENGGSVAADDTVVNSRYGDCSAHNAQRVLAFDPFLIKAVDDECAGTVDRQIVMTEDRRVRLILLAAGKNIFLRVRNGVPRSVCERDDGLLRVFYIKRGRIGALERQTVQHKADRFPRCVDRDGARARRTA